MRVSSVALLLAMTTGILAAQSQPPSPRRTRESHEPQAQPASVQEQTAPDVRGTNQSPLVVHVEPTPKTQQETADEKAQRDDQSAANWWMVRLTGAVVFMTLVQILVNFLQARRLKETIEKMDEIARGQNADMVASINEAARAAGAMESMAASMSTSAAASQRSADASAKSAGIADNALRIAHRAHIIVQGLTLKDFAIGSEPQFTFRLINAGASLARITAQNVEFVYGPKLPPTPFFSAQPPEMGPLMLAGRESKKFTVLSSAVSKEIYEAVAREQIFVFMYGRVDYGDIFDTPRVTRFCFRYKFNVAKWSFHTVSGYYESD